MIEISVNGGDPIKNDLKYGMVSGRTRRSVLDCSIWVSPFLLDF